MLYVKARFISNFLVQTCVLVLCYVVLLLAFPGCRSKESPADPSGLAGSPMSRYASQWGVKELDDSHNPYKDQYDIWDHWLAANCTGVYRGLAAGSEAIQCERGEMLMSSILDESGYIVPILEFQRQFEESRTIRSEDSFYRNSVIIFAKGPMNESMLKDFQTRVDEVRCTYYQKIPSWLAEKPPLAAVILPNGDVVTKGELGSGMSTIIKPNVDSSQINSAKPASEDGCCGGNDLSSGWFRYSATGEPLGYTNKKAWWFLYYDAEVNDLPPGSMAGRSDGYVIFKDPTSGSVLSVYDYDGILLEPVEPAPRDIHPFSVLRTHRLIMFYNAQQRVAKASSDK